MKTNTILTYGIGCVAVVLLVMLGVFFQANYDNKHPKENCEVERGEWNITAKGQTFPNYYNYYNNFTFQSNEEYIASLNGTCSQAGDCSADSSLKGCSMDDCNYVCCSDKNPFGCTETLMWCYHETDLGKRWINADLNKLWIDDTLDNATAIRDFFNESIIFDWHGLTEKSSAPRIGVAGLTEKEVEEQITQEAETAYDYSQLRNYLLDEESRLDQYGILTNERKQEFIKKDKYYQEKIDASEKRIEDLKKILAENEKAKKEASLLKNHSIIFAQEGEVKEAKLIITDPTKLIPYHNSPAAEPSFVGSETQGKGFMTNISFMTNINANAKNFLLLASHNTGFKIRIDDRAVDNIGRVEDGYIAVYAISQGDSGSFWNEYDRLTTIGKLNYYFSQSGNDSNDCLTLETACKTIGRMNEFTFKAGDNIYLNLDIQQDCSQGCKLKITLDEEMINEGTIGEKPVSTIPKITFPLGQI